MDIGESKEQKIISNNSITQKMKILQEIDKLMSQMNSEYNEGMFALSSIHFRNSESQYSLNPNAYQVGPAKRHVKIDSNKLTSNSNHNQILFDVYQLNDNIENEYKFECDSDDEDDLEYLKNSNISSKEQQEIMENQQKMKQFLDDLMKNQNQNAQEKQPTIEQVTKRTNSKKEKKEKKQNQQEKDDKNEKAMEDQKEQNKKSNKEVEIEKKKILNQMLSTDEQIIQAFRFQSKVFGIEAAQFQFKQFLNTILKLASYLTVLNQQNNQKQEKNI